MKAVHPTGLKHALNHWAGLRRPPGRSTSQAQAALVASVSGLAAASVAEPAWAARVEEDDEGFDLRHPEKVTDRVEMREEGWLS